jgi:hypothetical protein
VQLSLHTALQYRCLGLLSGFDFLKLDSLSPQWTSCVDVVMTRLAEGHRLSFEGYHPFYPFWLFPSWVFVEIFHGSYMMDFYFVCGSTEFTDFR